MDEILNSLEIDNISYISIKIDRESNRHKILGYGENSKGDLHQV